MTAKRDTQASPDTQAATSSVVTSLNTDRTRSHIRVVAEGRYFSKVELVAKFSIYKDNTRDDSATRNVGRRFEKIEKVSFYEVRNDSSDLKSLATATIDSTSHKWTIVYHVDGLKSETIERSTTLTSKYLALRKKGQNVTVDNKSRDLGPDLELVSKRILSVLRVTHLQSNKDSANTQVKTLKAQNEFLQAQIDELKALLQTQHA